MKAPLPPDEPERLNTLLGYQILDTGTEPEYDDLTLLASQLCATPEAMITLVDETRQWFKSRIGTGAPETPREVAFCAHTILQKDVMVVADARADVRFASNPLVTGQAGTRFYAGAPLLAPGGHAIGTLCVVDTVPRELSAQQKAALQTLSRQVVAHLELRRSVTHLRQTVADLKKADEELRWKTAFLEAQVNSSPDGILVVDPEGRKILQNQKTVDLLNIPQQITDDKDHGKQIQWVADQTKNPGQFIEKVAYLYSHPEEIGYDEVEFKSGRIEERHSSPVVGKDGQYYGRIWMYRDITARKKTEESLRLLGSAVEQARESIVITDAELDLPGPRIVFVNPAYTRMTGYTASEAIGTTPRSLHGPRTDKAVLHRLRSNLERGEDFAGETINYRKDGSEFTIEWQVGPIRDGAGAVTHYVAIQRDISERRRLETRLFESQKLETVGKLAGGIAHEFNSILTAIIGQSERLLADLPTSSPLTENATEISTAASRAATLTRQLLAYGRKQLLQPETLDLNRVIASMEGALAHLLGGEVNIRVVPATNLRAVKADAGQIEQVIMNMVINARDAMPDGGKLTLETANVVFDKERVTNDPEIKSGSHVMLAITDTGTGMSDEAKARLFEPFFSTKGVGRGTGLGLSTCYGIIKQSGGHITVSSQLARGTVFKIYLPCVETSAKSAPQRLGSPDLPRGTETILLVEDDPALREMATALLERLGYTVLAAVHGVEALNFKQQPGTGHIDVLFTDVVMPQMSGHELAERVRSLSPRTRILFSSAYTENASDQQGTLGKGAAILQKPFTPSALAKKLREVLDQPDIAETETGPTALR